MQLISHLDVGQQTNLATKLTSASCFLRSTLILIGVSTLFLLPPTLALASNNLVNETSLQNERSLEPAEIDEMLTQAENIRTQSPSQLVERLPLIEQYSPDFTEEQYFRLALLKSHSYTLANEQDQAVAVLKVALGKYFSTENLKYKTRILSLLANVYSHFNDYTASITTLHQLLPLLNDVNDIESEVYGYTLAIEIFYELSLFDEALKYAKILQGRFSYITNKRQQCFAHHNYAQGVEGVYGKLESHFQELDQLYVRAAEYCELANENMVLSSIKLYRAKLLSRFGFIKESTQLALKGLQLAKDTPYDFNVASNYLLLGKLAIASSNLDLAQQYFTAGLSIAKQLNKSLLLAQLYHAISLLNEQSGEFKQALASLKLHLYHRDQYLDESRSKIIAFEAAKLDSIERERNLRYMAYERKLLDAKAVVSASERRIEQTALIVVVGLLCFLVVFASVTASQRRQFKRLAQFDGLTNIYNRSTGQVMAEEQFIAHMRSGRPFSLIMFDLDNFKAINDRFGHGTGDWVLKKVTEVTLSYCQGADIFARFGGEEFAIFMPYTDLTSAELQAQRIQKALSEIDSNLSGHSFKVSASFGVTTGESSDLSIDPLLRRADIAMYAAKKGGRDRVEIYSIEVEQQMTQSFEHSDDE